MIPNVKDFDKLLGMGVAIQCNDNFVRKFKVKAVNVCYDGNGRRVSGIAVDAPQCQSEYWKRVGWLRRDGDWWWLYPVFAFRSKGNAFGTTRTRELLKRTGASSSSAPRLKSISGRCTR